MSISEESRRLLNDCRFRVSRNVTVYPFASGTRNKRTRMYKIASQYESDVNIDFGCGMINREQHDSEIKAIRMFEQMLANYEITD